MAVAPKVSANYAADPTTYDVGKAELSVAGDVYESYAKTGLVTHTKEIKSDGESVPDGMLFGNECAAKAVCDYDVSDTGFEKGTLKSGVSVDVKMYDAGEFSPASKVIKHLTGTEKKVDNVNTLKLKESTWTEDQYIDFTCGSATKPSSPDDGG
ncbi:MAG: hypothetical protein LBP35_00995 [Candidatus Ancillula trichonymphae]|nr:hypothetical protein [Candidatus Ancillula trichonymphae]